MKKIKLTLLMLWISIIVFTVASCTSEKKSNGTDSASTDSTYVAVDSSANLSNEEYVIPDTQELIEESNAEMAKINTSSKTLLFSKGAVWKMWDKIFKEYLKNAHFKNPTYLGVSNTLDIGSVFNDDDQLLWNFDKLVTTAEKKRITTVGNNPSLVKTEKSLVNFESLVNIGFSSVGIEGELSNALKNQKDLSVNITSSQINKLDAGLLNKFLSSSQDETIKAYKASVYNKNTKIISQVVIINGFSSTIILDKDISATLKAGLEKGIIKGIDNSDAKLKFEYKSANEITVSSIGSFIVFADIVNSLKLMRSVE